MKLEKIGFYSLADKRAKTAGMCSDLQRCELILSDKCNFKCSYCRGLKNDIQGDIPIEDAQNIVCLWAENNLKNIRFSGGEPTIYPHLLELVEYTRQFSCFEHIALSTNGSADLSFYKKLIKAGINDFSISLDACCSANADMMAGTNSHFNHISKVIKYISKQTYCTVGVVLTEKNNQDLKNIIEYATSLGVSDIRIIPSAQSNHKLNVDVKTKYPILKYRLNNIKRGRHVRGIGKKDNHKCPLVLDDMVIVKNKHYPCVIYMREQGKEIGTVDNKNISEIRKERQNWYENTDVFKDKICRKNCLDVCIDYNNAFRKFHSKY